MPLPRPAHARQRQLGSAAIAAVAVIVLVGLVGAALVSSLRISSRSQTSLLQATQAFLIADAGIEWACKQNSPTPSPMSLGNGTFTVTSAGGQWVSLATVGDTRCTFRCQPLPVAEPISNGLDYVDESRSGAVTSNLVFRMMNNTANSITFNKIKITWSPDRVAYFQYLDTNVIGGVNQRVWTKASNPPSNYGWGNTELRQFNVGSPVTIPSHYSAELTFTNFYKTPGGAGGLQPMNGHTFVLEFYNGATLVGQMNVGLPPS